MSPACPDHSASMKPTTDERAPSLLKSPWRPRSISRFQCTAIILVIIFIVILAVMLPLLLWHLGLIGAHSFASSTSLPSGLQIPTGLRLTNSSKQFRISIFEDLHFGENEGSSSGPHQDQASLQVMSKVLSAESPDFVVFNGDLISGQSTFSENSTSYLNQLLEPIVRQNVRFATTFGNHDNDRNLSTTALLQKEQTSFTKLSLTRAAIPTSESVVGVSNYFLPVFFSGNTSRRPDLLLWFFDSKGGRTFNTDNQIKDQVDPKVADWFQTTSASLKSYYGHEIPGLAFVHIPPSVMRDFEAKNRPLDPKRYPGLITKGLAAQHGDDAFVKAITQDPSVKAVFSAHDHGCDWCMPYSKPNHGGNMFFCMGRHTGYGGGGNWMRGSRILEVDVDVLTNVEIKTWIRFEDGTAGETIMLNATYGTDVYNEVPVRCTYLGVKGNLSCGVEGAGTPPVGAARLPPVRKGE